MPLQRKCLSGHAKCLKKKKDVELVKSLRRSLDRFFTKEPEVLGEHLNFVNEEHTDREEFADDTGENGNDEDVTDLDDEQATPLNIFDPRNWDSLDKKLIDLLVEKDHIRDLSIENGPLDKFSRHFSSRFYTRFLENGEKHDREWLVYSKELDKVFCLCCKLLKKGPMRGQLPNDGYNDGRHLSKRLKEHEMSSGHIINANTWIDLRLRLQRNETIDRSFQDQIRKEKKHRRNVLKRIIAIVSFFFPYVSLLLSLLCSYKSKAWRAAS